MSLHPNLVAGTILQQLGGNKFLMMTGGKPQFQPSQLVIGLPGKPGFVKDGINFVRIEIDEATDTYNMKFIKANKRARRVDTIAEVTGVYADRLQAVFTEITGLRTCL